MYRLYYWIKGAREKRAGGPWWCRDFKTKAELYRFFDDIKPFLYKFCLTDGKEEVDPNRASPPKGFEIAENPL